MFEGVGGVGVEVRGVRANFPLFSVSVSVKEILFIPIVLPFLLSVFLSFLFSVCFLKNSFEGMENFCGS